MEKFLGRHIQIIADGVKYHGFIKAVDQVEKKIVLTKVVNYDTGKKFKKEMHFFGEEIKQLTILEDVLPDTDGNQSKELENQSQNQNHLFMDASDNGTSLFQMKRLQPNLYLSGLDSIEPCVNTLNEPPEAILIDKLDGGFVDAIKDISKQKVISFVADGKKIDRFGDVSFVTIGTRLMIYLFDLHGIGADNFFVNGIQNILQNPDILKVIHDVRLLSDCLSAKHNILLINVFDTQVADAFIYKNNHGRFPQEVSSLSQCIMHHLKLAPEEVAFEKEKKNMQKKMNFWHHRPLSMKYQRYCAKASVYLRELRTVMLEKLLAEYLHGVDIYLKDITEKSDNAAKYTSIRKFPAQFDKFTSGRRFRDVPRKYSGGSLNADDEVSDVDGYHSDQPKRRSAWDNGTEFSDQYQKRHGEIVECLNKTEPMFDNTKPLLKSRNSPVEKNSSSQRQQNETIAATNSYYLPNKSDLQSNEFQFSTSETEDNDNGFMLGTDDNGIKEIDETFTRKQDHMRKEKISDAGLRMIRDAIRQNEPKRKDGDRRDENISHIPSKLSTFDLNREFSTLQLEKEKNLNSIPVGITPPKHLKPRGRGQMLKSMTEQCRSFNPSPTNAISHSNSPNRQLANGKVAYDFPTDEELLALPQVTPEVNGATVGGQKVVVFKKFTKD